MKVPAHQDHKYRNPDHSAAQTKLTPTLDPIQQKAYDAIQRFNEQTVQQFVEEEEPASMKADLVQRSVEEEEPASMKAAPVQRSDEEEEPASMKADPVQRSAVNENSTGMPDGVKTQMEGAFNASFSDVSIHTDSVQAKNMNALAYTQGTDVHFAPGQFKPESKNGQELLGHELTHVLQQKEGRVKPTTEVGASQ